MKAHSDLHTASQIGALPDGHLDAAIYHCQQAAEKALKEFLVFNEVSAEKTHDLSKILKQTIRINPSFQKLEEAAASLTPYSVAYRYPDEFSIHEPSREEFDAALQKAQAIYDFVLNLLPKEAQP